MNCDPSSLAAAAVCFDRCIPPGEQAAVQTYLLAQIAFNMNATTTTDPQALLTAALQSPNSFLRIKGAELEVMAYLLCQIAGASGA